MPRALIALPIAPSSLQLVAHGALLGGGVWVTGACLGLTEAVLLAAAGAGQLLWQRVSGPRGTLEICAVPGGDESEPAAVTGRFRPAGGAAPEDAWRALRCDYLGPWLVGLRLGRRRFWVWPDSAPGDARRRVRRLFHHPGRS